MLQLKQTAQGVSIPVQVVPRASRSQVVGVLAGALKVSLAAPPVDGAANAALCELIAERLGVPRRTVTISHGEHSKSKTVQVQGVDLAHVERALAPPEEGSANSARVKSPGRRPGSR